MPGQFLDEMTKTDDTAKDLLKRASEKLGLTARGYHRILRVARTLQDIHDMQNNMDINIVTPLGFPALAGALAFRM
jgi:magnesium chelatase family protein